jgi:hypothetical protein
MRRAASMRPARNAERVDRRDDAVHASPEGWDDCAHPSRMRCDCEDTTGNGIFPCDRLDVDQMTPGKAASGLERVTPFSWERPLTLDKQSAPSLVTRLEARRQGAAF